MYARRLRKLGAYQPTSGGNEWVAHEDEVELFGQASDEEDIDNVHLTT